MSKPTLATYGGALLDIGYAGNSVDQNRCTIENYINSGATGIDFGVAVARAAGDAENTCKVPAADSDVLVGISKRHATMPYGTAGTVLYPQYAAVPVTIEDYCFCIPFENVTREDVVLSITAQGGKLGGTTGGAAGAGRVAFPARIKATWMTTTVAGQVGIVRISG